MQEFFSNRVIGPLTKSEVNINGRMRQLARKCGGASRVGFYYLAMRRPDILEAVLDAEPPSLSIKTEDADIVDVDIGIYFRYFFFTYFIAKILNLFFLVRQAPI